MKKSLAFVFAFFVLLSSSAANAASQITALNASGHPGDTVSIDVSFAGDDATFLGGDFAIGFDSTKLLFVDAIGASSDFFPFFDSSTGVLFLSYIGDHSTSFGSIFSILFAIADPYPASNLPDTTDVAISSLLYFDAGLDSNFDPITSTEQLDDVTPAPFVTVLARNGGTLPEPGALALVALALLAMMAVTRRGRAKRG